MAKLCFVQQYQKHGRLISFEAFTFLFSTNSDYAYFLFRFNSMVTNLD